MKKNLYAIVMLIFVGMLSVSVTNARGELITYKFRTDFQRDVTEYLGTVLSLEQFDTGKYCFVSFQEQTKTGPGYCFLTDAEINSISSMYTGASFHPTAFPDNNTIVVRGSYCSGFDCNGSFWVLPKTPTHAMGFEIMNSYGGPVKGRWVATVAFSDGTSEDIILPEVILPVYPWSKTKFFGAISKKQISGIHFGGENASQWPDGRIEIDDLFFANNNLTKDMRTLGIEKN